MNQYNRLFSFPQIVGISIFLSIGLLFVITGFQFSESINMPTIPNPFTNYCDTVSPQKQPYCKVAQKHTDIIQFGKVTPELMRSQKTIEATACEDLPALYNTNGGWTLRNYIAYRITYECP